MTLNDLKCPKMALNDSKQLKMTRKDINEVNDICEENNFKWLEMMQND